MTQEEVFYFAKEAYHEAAVVDIERLPLAGSDRVYYRIYNGVQRSIIATQSNNITENERFLSLASYFDKQGIAVPQILAVHPNKTLYLQSEAGKESLLDVVIKNGHTEGVKEIYKKALAELIQFQLCAHKPDFAAQFASLPAFGYQQILYDLNYFKNNFALKTQVAFDAKKLDNEFEQLAKSLDKEHGYFMYRDCQGRNIMIKEDALTFIDFQGGMQGHPMYDVASLLWQAKATLPPDWKRELLDFYISRFEAITLERGLQIDCNAWRQDYQLLTLTRLLQVLGAYGLRGLAEGKEHFISSIPLGLKNILEWKTTNSLDALPVLNNILEQISSDAFIRKFEEK